MSNSDEALCAICGEHANEHGSIGHVFTDRATVLADCRPAPLADVAQRLASSARHPTQEDNLRAMLADSPDCRLAPATEPVVWESQEAYLRRVNSTPTTHPLGCGRGMGYQQ
jgi:hypothetical protein